MRIRISHEIAHRYAPPARMLIQNLRLTPCGFDSQYVTGWRIGVDIDTMLRQNEDEHGNIVSTFSHHGAPVERLTVWASGEVETSDAAGVMRGTIERLPPEMYLRESRLAHANGALRAFAKEAAAGAADPLDGLHRLMGELHRVMAFDPFKPDDPESAVEAFALRRGRARDFAHIFIACARFLGLPARYICGYRAADEAGGEPGAHAWAEAYRPEARLGRLRRDRLPLRRRPLRARGRRLRRPGQRVRPRFAWGRRGRCRDGDPGRAGGVPDAGVRREDRRCTRRSRRRRTRDRDMPSGVAVSVERRSGPAPDGARLVQPLGGWIRRP